MHPVQHRPWVGAYLGRALQFADQTTKLEDLNPTTSVQMYTSFKPSDMAFLVPALQVYITEGTGLVTKPAAYLDGLLISTEKKCTRKTCCRQNQLRALGLFARKGQE